MKPITIPSRRVRTIPQKKPNPFCSMMAYMTPLRATMLPTERSMLPEIMIRVAEALTRMMGTDSRRRFTRLSTLRKLRDTELNPTTISASTTNTKEFLKAMAPADFLGRVILRSISSSPPSVQREALREDGHQGDEPFHDGLHVG